MALQPWAKKADCLLCAAVAAIDDNDLRTAAAQISIVIEMIKKNAKERD